ncbi:alpha/beta fold hydrolase [Glacieibacterium megasporae]|uniref:alpha/beta fold hydrolase n=1 Tax=Glacieibacterium megasporae TaxID=2835787 RepID=UPI0034E1DAFE
MSRPDPDQTALAGPTTSGEAGPIHGDRHSQARRRLRVNGVGLAYRDVGRGDGSQILHGWPETSHAWRKLIPLLSEDYRVIAPPRGIEGSSKPQDGYDQKAVAADAR